MSPKRGRLPRDVGRRILLGVVLLCAAGSLGHVNSPHIFLEQDIGPYPAYVTLHMPPAIPGEAELQIMLHDVEPGEAVEVLTREIPPQGAEHAPDWFPVARSAVETSFFSAPVPLMDFGLWHIEVRVDGERGQGQLSFPVPARVPRPRVITAWLGAALVALTLLLTVTLLQMMRGLGRDSVRQRGSGVEPEDRRRGRRYAILGVIAWVVYLSFIGRAWRDFDEIARWLATNQLTSEVTLQGGPAAAGTAVTVEIDIRGRGGDPLTDVVPDHGKMMHLVVVDEPDATHFIHVHPEMTEPSVFAFEFTPPTAGAFRLFGDILRSTGETETVTGVIEVGAGSAPDGWRFADADDSHSVQPPIGARGDNQAGFEVGDGMVMRWSSSQVPVLKAGDFHRLTFELVDREGRPVDGIEPYVGMQGHMLVLRDDFDVFAHIYPRGTLATPAGEQAAEVADPDDDVPEHPEMLPPVVRFPYGFPEAGLYRLWVQMRRGDRVYTGVFDVRVE